MPSYYVFRSSRSNSIASIRSIRNLRRVGQMLNENEGLWNKEENGSKGNRTPVILLNQVQPSLLSTMRQHKWLCAGTTIYAILSVLLTICCIVQCIYRFHHFLFYPTTVNVKFEENETLTPPCVTVCATDLRYNRNPVIWQPFLKTKVGDVNYTDAYDLMKKTNISIDELWDMSRFGLKNLNYYVVQGNLWSGYQRKKTVLEFQTLTVNGVCSTFKPSEELPCIGMLSGIKIKSNEDKELTNNTFRSYAVTFHEEDEIPVVKYYGTLGTGVHLPYRQHINTALKLRLISNVDSWNDDCDTRAYVAKCVAECIEAHILMNSNLTQPCRLPYMDETSSLPPCVTAEEFRDIYTATEFVLRNIHVDSECDCPKSCKSIAYNANYFFREPTEDLFDLFVNFPDCEIQIIEEEVSYGLSSLWSDIGGALGLFLGISMLSLYDLATNVIKRQKKDKKCCC